MSTVRSVLFIFLIIACPTLVFALLRDISIGLQIVAAVFIIIVLLFIFMILGLYSRKRITRTLFEDCDPERFIAACRRTTENPFVNENSKAGSIARLDLALGLKAAGYFEEAVGALNNVHISQKLKSGALFNMIRSGLKFELLLNFENIEEAKNELINIENIAKDIANRIPRLAEAASRDIEGCRLALRVAEGNIEGAEEFFNASFQSAKNKYGRVSAKYDLGLIYTKLNKKEKTQEAFQYTAAHGNKLFIAKEARRLVKELLT